MKRLIILSVLAMSVMACCAKKENNTAIAETATAANKPASHFEHLKSGTQGGRERASNEVITSQSELDGLYNELKWGEAPMVDFAQKNVVALFMGQKSSGGYKIGIENLSVQGNKATVRISRTSPEGMATSVMTQPYFVAAINKTDKVVFE